MKSTSLKISLLALVILAVLSSCNKRTQLLYINNIANESIKTPPIPKYTLKPGDVLFIQIFTQNATVFNLFNNKGLSDNTDVNGYSVSDSGYVQLPVLGKLKLVNLTINQCRDLIQTQTEKYLNDGIAVVKLLSFKVTILGEVKKPGIIFNPNDNLTIFEGLGLAGDLTDFAERTSVLLMRQTPDGVKTIRVNLQDKNLLNSDAYYLVPNDMLVVEPRKGKIFTMNSPNISITVSIISTSILLLSYILK